MGILSQINPNYSQKITDQNVAEGFIGADVRDVEGNIIERVNYFPDADTRSALDYSVPDTPVTNPSALRSLPDAPATLPAQPALPKVDPSLPKYQGMRDATVQHLKNKGIMSDEEFRIAELNGNTKDPIFTYSIDDSGSNSSYITLKKTIDYDEKYGRDYDEQTIRFSDHSLPSQHSFGRNIFNVSEDYYDETIDGKTLNDATSYLDRLIPPSE